MWTGAGLVEWRSSVGSFSLPISELCSSVVPMSRKDGETWGIPLLTCFQRTTVLLPKRGRRVRRLRQFFLLPPVSLDQ
jgi:hypothetical protein